MTLYTVRVACEVAGHWRTPDVPFHLTDAQALLLAAPHGSVVAPYVLPAAVHLVEALPEPTNDRQHRRQRKHRRSAK